MEHFAFPGRCQAADDRRIFMYYSWKAHVFYNIHLWNNVYNRWITSNFPFRWHRTASTTRGWKSPIFNRNSSEERRLKFIASGEDDEDKKPRNLVPRVLSYPPPWSERERETLENAGHVAPEQNYFLGRSPLSHMFLSGLFATFMQWSQQQDRFDNPTKTITETKGNFCLNKTIR